MKKLLLLLAITLPMAILSSCQDKYEAAFKNVCKNAIVGAQDGGVSYTATIEDIGNQQDYVNKIKDNFDKASNIVGEKQGDLPTSDGKGIGTFYTWESPTIRIILVDEKRIGGDGEIKAIVVKK